MHKYGCVCVCVCVCVLVTQLWLTLCNPVDCSYQALLSMDSLGKNTGEGSHSLLQGIFLTQRLSPSLHWQADSLPAEHKGSPIACICTEILIECGFQFFDIRKCDTKYKKISPTWIITTGLLIPMRPLGQSEQRTQWSCSVMSDSLQSHGL